jgi:hypothetical protein
MVLAVNWPPQAPAPGQAWFSIVQQFGVAHAARGVGAHGFEDVLNGDVAAVVASGQNRPAVENHARER